MKITHAVKRACTCYAHQLPDMLLFTLLTLAVHAMPVVPLLFLLDKSMYPGLILCAVLFIALVLPLRMNAAEVMQHALRGERIFSIELVSFRDYGMKLGQGLKRTALLLLWAAPALAATAWAYSMYVGANGVDVISLFKPIKQFGGGDLIRGVINVAIVYVLLWMPLALGCAVHSGARHADVLGRKKLLRGHRVKQVLCWCMAELPLLPWAIAVSFQIRGYVDTALTALKGLALDHLLPSNETLITIAVMTVVLLVPVLPLRDMIIAAWPAEIYDAEQQKEAA